MYKGGLVIIGEKASKLILTFRISTKSQYSEYDNHCDLYYHQEHNKCNVDPEEPIRASATTTRLKQCYTQSNINH